MTIVKVVLITAGSLAILVVVFLASRSLMSKPPKETGAPGRPLPKCSSRPNCVSSQATDADHQVAPFPFTGSPDDALRRLSAAVSGMPRAVIVEQAPGYLHATFTSGIFRFVDDLEAVVDPAAKVIHVRSASRVGYSDLGVNRKRVEALRALYQGR